jgi:hypothetical protein
LFFKSLRIQVFQSKSGIIYNVLFAQKIQELTVLFLALCFTFNKREIYMRKGIVVLLLLFFCVYDSVDASKSIASTVWGFYGHKRINRMATFTLPPEMFPFFKRNIEYVTEHAVDPDKRRYAAEGEAPRHYIDIDHYIEHGEDPFEVVPKMWDEAVVKFTEDTLLAYGIVPWHIEVMIGRLTQAFREKDAHYILSMASDLGHYIGDAHVPLHTTENYNGQFTDQKGIHGFWESRIPEMHANDYDYFTGRATYIENISDEVWDVVRGSHYALDSVLGFEKDLTQEFATDEKYSYETRGATTVKVYSKDFTNEYNAMMGDMVERRMRQSIIMVGSAWYTAWVKAGQPDLDELDQPVVSEEELQRQKELELKFRDGKIKGREHAH